MAEIPTCRVCQHAIQQDRELICRLNYTPAKQSWQICARVTLNRDENAAYDARCRSYALACHKYERDFFRNA